ncbi:protein regulator of cytokinesis 1-like [Ixodes scapularis]|uniref:protein regulator of cytokinesis 1-like n=1 Tax=Ixodes scapularis TaxID=6945 RepID=UPI001C382AAC|nr:protein regulator of cytokinesis 1-like [Ixodes scapularis]
MHGLVAFHKSLLSDDVERTVHALGVLWKEIGVPDDEVLRRHHKLRDCIVQALGDILAGEVEIRDRLLKSISDTEAHVAVLTRELQVHAEKPDEELPLLDTEQFLGAQVRELTALQVSRRRKLKDLLGQERRLCTHLAVPPYRLDVEMPTERELHELGLHVQMLKDVEGRRATQLHSMRSEVLALLEELSETPQSSFQCELIDSTPATFRLSASNLSAVDDYLRVLKSLHAARVAEYVQLYARLCQLWMWLAVPQERQRAFTSKHSGLGEDTIEALKSELASYEALKRELIQARQRVINVRDVPLSGEQALSAKDVGDRRLHGGVPADLRGGAWCGQEVPRPECGHLGEGRAPQRPQGSPPGVGGQDEGPGPLQQPRGTASSSGMGAQVPGEATPGAASQHV